MTRYKIIYQNSNVEAPKGRFNIGRSIECNLVLDDPSVSRVHATIIHDQDDRLYLEDNNSRNGCAVNDIKVTGKTVLKDGDKVTIGHQIIRIATMNTASAAEKNTMGIMICQSCRGWMETTDTVCPNCQTPSHRQFGESQTQVRSAFSVTPQRKETSSRPPTQQSQQMLAGVIKKAIGKEKYDEAHKLLGTLMESTLKKDQSRKIINETDLLEICRISVELADQAGNPAYISELFAFFTRLTRLMPREAVELLYGSVRRVGYRVCPDMNQYISLMGDISRDFSPGDKFILRRLNGLTGLCS